jgi:lipopolysaccharide transport system ATP-binding protein
MTDSVIRAEGLGKRYRIRHNAERERYYRTLRDVMADGVKRGFGRLTAALRAGAGAYTGSEKPPLIEDFWALKDVSFEVKRGEVVGIIGRNGAGKSTLLKVLSRITEPTSGRAHLKGRVASLLEVGTGFHPELTGRENIFLNGAVLGMSRQEIKRKFDQIVEFAEIERFLDTPVKRYSSGMYVRLAFAVAAHLEPEILIVDEVLAVGDARFQKKCLERMDKIGSEGVAVLFVSHNIGMVSKLCQTGMLLEQGKLVTSGAINDVVNSYLAAPLSASSRFIAPPTDAPLLMSILEAETVGGDEVPKSEFAHDEFVTLKITCALNCPNSLVLERIRLTVALIDGITRRVFTSQTSVPSNLAGDSRISVRMRIPSGLLTEGNYAFIISANIPPAERIHRVEEVCPFYIRDRGSEFAHDSGDIGCVFVDCDWIVELAKSSEAPRGYETNAKYSSRDL